MGTGIFGGAFNPIHLGHLRLAEEVAQTLQLTQVRFIPTGQPPHRAAATVPAEQRLAMVELAIAGNPRFVADPRELNTTAVSYTIDTVTGLQHEQPDTQLTLILGADQLQALTTWSRWEKLCDKVALAVAARPGYDIDQAQLPAALQAFLAPRWTSGIPQRGQVRWVPVTALDISSSAIRAHLATGHSARYLLPQRVLDYIRAHHLYLEHHAN